VILDVIDENSVHVEDGPSDHRSSAEKPLF
jgi:hypothetical protein